MKAVNQNMAPDTKQKKRKRISKLPKYLLKRKLELLRCKTLARKYAYRYYRKTISRVLPSTAIKHHQMRTKTNAFNAWKKFWFEERVVWRLTLRSTLHFNVKLKRTTFKRWRYFVVLRVEGKLKWRIAEKHHEITLKAKALVSLQFNGKFERESKALADSQQNNYEIAYLDLNVCRLHENFLRTYEQYLVMLFVYEGYKIHATKRCFEKLKLHAAERRKFKAANRKALEFFRAKHGAQELKPYFVKMLDYKNQRKEMARKNATADNYCADKLKRKGFNGLRIYCESRKIKKEMRMKSDEFYERRLLTKAFGKLKSYADVRLEKKLKTGLAEAFHVKSALRKCLRKFHANVINRNKQKEKIMRCEEIFKRKLLERAFFKLLDYNASRKQKRLKNAKLIGQLQAKFARTLLRRLFTKWKIFRTLISEEKEKIELASRLREKTLTKKAFRSWRWKLESDKQKKALIVKSDRHYARLIFKKWTGFVSRNKIHRERLEEARKFYQKKLLQTAVRCVLSAGFERRRIKERNALKKVQAQYSIGLKYFAAWKSKALKTKTGTTIVSNGEIEPFKWHPLCFTKPLVPDYLKSYLETE